MKIKIAAVILAGVFFISGCVMMDTKDRDRNEHHRDKSYHKPGPPPHAPAHGYRYRHADGHDLEYDSKIDAYIVLGIPDVYFCNNLYVRISSDGRWLVSEGFDRGWRQADRDDVPYKLKKNKESNNKDHKKNRHDDRDKDN